MGAIATHSGNNFECCTCGRSVHRVEDLRAKSPLDASFLQQHGRYHDTRYYASSRVLTNVGFCSSKCFSKKLVPQIDGNVNVVEIARLINQDARYKLSVTLNLQLESISNWEFVTHKKLTEAFTRINQEPQSFSVEANILQKALGRGIGKTGIFYWRKFPIRFSGHVIGACSLLLDDGGARNCAITCVVFFIADSIEFSGRRESLEVDGSGSSHSHHDPFDD